MARRGLTSLHSHRAAIAAGETPPRLTLRQSVDAFCCDCMGEFKDGILDCKNLNCPLYPHMYYNPSRLKTAHKGNPTALRKRKKVI